MSKQEIGGFNYVCKLCDKYYKTERNYLIHNKKFHNNEPEILPEKVQKEPTSQTTEILVNKLQCKYCNSTFKYKQSIKIHERKCKNKFKKNNIATQNIKTIDVVKAIIEADTKETIEEAVEETIDKSVAETVNIEPTIIYENKLIKRYIDVKTTEPIDYKPIIIKKITNKNIWFFQNIINKFCEWILPIKNKNI
jgi:hypothetical protein